MENGSFKEEQCMEEAVNEQPKALSFLELVYGVFFTPVKTLRYVCAQRKVAWGLVLFLGTYLFDSLMNFAVGRAYLPNLGISPQEAQILNGLLSMGWLFGLPLIFAFWFGLISIYHALAGLFGSQGSVQGILAGFGFSSLPVLVSSVLSFLGNALKSSGVPLNLLGFAIFVWIAVLQIIALKENYGISYGKAAAVYIIPLAFLLISLFSIFILFFSILVPLVQSYLPNF
ncbi:Yip1 family protein [Zhaonella formicivorans]|uniref:Yip1 family protein n=1 Tax=Zhaonella formicivorans TaxID=2528593 RepID=UPI0010ECDC65|nr:Yip1 family protein [Zhaonella formicivorans]